MPEKKQKFPKKSAQKQLTYLFQYDRMNKLSEGKRCETSVFDEFSEIFAKRLTQMP